MKSSLMAESTRVFTDDICSGVSWGVEKKEPVVKKVRR